MNRKYGKHLNKLRQDTVLIKKALHADIISLFNESKRQMFLVKFRGKQASTLRLCRTSKKPNMCIDSKQRKKKPLTVYHTSSPTDSRPQTSPSFPTGRGQWDNDSPRPSPAPHRGSYPSSFFACVRKKSRQRLLREMFVEGSRGTVLRRREGEKINPAAFGSNAAFQLEEVYLKSSSCLVTSAV